ncbi:hypothetical protein I302_107834 [Kwoniella bestiolae CBS 10118]|uniref:alpha-L-rhamnosidase n=1 Tax=Kwoniella bestiolae CBS 10118 TaxID=1296100 RepID=A0A1B9FXF2_9TREE|nr:hypothetical protein I302_06426 [Kwoniella bestiolae CBS 10118]OCF23444.1 hypothetical protein I302_06426 [Kwoniella bestiolae CBS 10118]
MPSLTDPISISTITFERSRNGVVGTSEPRISWRFEGDAQDWYQASYDIRFKRTSGVEEYHHDTSKSIFVPWSSGPLRSGEVVEVSVRSVGPDGSRTPWTSARVEAALLNQSDWKADMISVDCKPHTNLAKPSRPFILRRHFDLPSISKPARLYATAFGMYDIKINGQVVGDQVLKPGWTSYDHRLYYQAFDVSSYLHVGSNIIEGHVAEGWYSGRLGFLGGKRNLYGENTGLQAQLMVGDEVVLRTDSSWTATRSPISYSGVYDGEKVDFRLAEDKLKELSVIVLDRPKAKFILDMAPIKRMQEISSKEIITTSSGKVIIDFGQNLVGWVRINTVPARVLPGDEIVLSHAEVLEHGELGTRPLRVAECQDTLVCGSDNSAFRGWEPTFTFHGFRYVQVDGWGGDVKLADFTAVVVYTDMERTGWFKSSHPLINKLHENVIWGMRGNFVGLPTDCPQRDERLGWSGDLTVFRDTANFLYDTSSILSGWLEDVAVEQEENSHIPPLVVPNILSRIYPQSPLRLAIWGDVAVLASLSLFEAFGDANVLAQQYDSMFNWLTQGIVRDENGLWRDKPEDTQLGDWLDPAAPPDFPGDGRTDPKLVADAYLVHVTRTMAEISRLLNKEEDALRFESEWKTLRQHYLDNYVSKTGRTVSDSQTALALSLQFDLLSDKQREVAIDRLETLVKKNVFKVATGFAGTPIILGVLAANDRLHLAYRMLQEKQCPSWLYTVSMGATTMWERWDSMRPDGTINPGEMTSFNHYALGSVASFLHNTIGGISPLEPGWKKFKVAPRPGGTVTSAEVKHLSPYGLIECSWHLKDEMLTVAVSVPPNSRAKVEIGDLDLQIGSGRREFVVKYKSDPRWPPKPIYNSMTIPLVDEIA